MTTEARRIGGAKLEALVLAAGAGARFGGAKLTAPWRDGVLLDGALAAAFASPARSVTVVTGADAGVEAAARKFADRIGAANRLRILHCPDHAEGMGATLRAGVANLPPDTAGVFVFLGDMPLIPAEVLPRLAEALAAGSLAAAPFFEGQRGHPTLISSALFPDLRALQGDQGAREVLRRLGPGLARVPAKHAGVRLDIDRPSDLDRAQSQ